MGCVKKAPKLKSMFIVVLRNVVLLYPCIGKSSTLSMEKQQKEGKYQERRMGCAKEAPKLKKIC
jgi:hypothetical protein